MSKSALGKGLGHLMNGDPVAGGPPRTPERKPAAFNRGFSALAASRAPSLRPPPKHLLPGWFLFAADILLLALALAVCFGASRPLRFGQVLFCAVCVALGGALSIIAVCRPRA